MKINILGTPYTIKYIDEAKDKAFIQADGYCDDSVHQIVVAKRKGGGAFDKKDMPRYEKSVLRHELVHAFLSESGLQASAGWAVNEEIVDWVAIQFPKMLKAMQEAGAL